jgi:hypothetical protein
MAMIRVQGLAKRYRKAKRNAVDGIDFEVEAGEFFARLARMVPARRQRYRSSPRRSPPPRAAP